MRLRDRSFAHLFALSLAYGVASLAHFVHNAEFLAQYPNMPLWLSRSKVYCAWLLIAVVGATGIIVARSRFALAGLLIVAAYATLGFDGLGHYALAPMAAHTFAMNLTIWVEVGAAAALLVFTLRQVFLAGWRSGNRQEDAGTLA